MYHWDALSGNVSLSCSLSVFILDKYYIIYFSWKKSLKQNITVSWSFLKHCRLLRNSSSFYFNFWKRVGRQKEEQGQVLLPSSCFIPSPVHSMHAQCSTSRHLHPQLKGLSVNFIRRGGEGGAFIYCPLSNYLFIFLFVWKIVYVSFGGQCLFKHTCFPQTISVQI